MAVREKDLIGEKKKCCEKLLYSVLLVKYRVKSIQRIKKRINFFFQISSLQALSDMLPIEQLDRSDHSAVLITNDQNRRYTSQ